MDIDELVVKLRLDPTGMVQGVKVGDREFKKFKDSAKVAADDVEHQAGRMVQGFSQVTKELLGLGAVILGLGGLKNLISGTVGAATATGNVASVFGLDPEMLSKWQGAMKAFGIEAGTTAGAIGGVAKSIADLRLRGGGDLLKGSIALQQMGITNPSMDPEKLLLQIQQALQNPKNQGPGVAQSILSDFPSVLPILRGLQASNLNELLKESQTATRQQIQAAQDVKESFTKLENAADRAANKLLEMVAPSATKAAETTAKAIDNIISGKPNTPLPLFGLEGGDFRGWIRNLVRQMGYDELQMQGGVLPQMSFGDRFGEWPAGAPGRYVPMRPETRSLPDGKGTDRYPGLNTFRSPASAAAAAGIGFQRPSDNINITANVNVTVPPGADPRTFGGLVATSLKQALPSVIGASR
jgi:hypothetical protein